jgi:hypothetical protein
MTDMTHIKLKNILNEFLGYPNVVEDSSNNPQTVTRIDSHPITDFGSNMQTYHHTNDWSVSGQFRSGEKIPKQFTSQAHGVFAGTPLFTALYATGNSSETSFVAKYSPGNPTVWFHKKDLPRIKGKKTYLTVFDAKDFKKTPSGEYFSKKPGKPIEQTPITDALGYITNQGWTIEYTDDLRTVLRQLKAKGYKLGSEGI